MWQDIATRFLLGGLVVSAFAIVGDLLTPKTFAGLFGAAPSVALGTLALAFSSRGSSFVAAECRTMIIGALGLVAYSAVVVTVARQSKLPVWLGAGMCWSVWMVVSFIAWTVVHQVGLG
jgi:hypothetical protein